MYNPHYTITPKIASDLIKIESLAQDIIHLPITPDILMHLRESARIESIHYSTKIEGNRLTQQEVKEVIESKHIPGKERDQKEVLGCYAASDAVEKWVKEKITITEQTIKTLHGIIMGGGKKRIMPTPYRDGQNVIRESATGSIVYLPPESGDVPMLMKDLVSWIDESKKQLVPLPIRAAIVHYQFATIHPYYDGNGRTARLLATLMLHLGHYDLKGIYSLDEYYANDLQGYYDALDIGPSHNYYMGRETADITSWIDYFCSGMAYSFERVKRQAIKLQKRGGGQTAGLQQLDTCQRKVIAALGNKEIITAHDIAKLLHVAPRTARAFCQKWVQEGFFSILDAAKKTRSYKIKKIKKGAIT